jgi:hypothetical protein
MLTSRLSKTKSRTTPLRDAPKAMRKAISRRRPVNLTSSRLATLLQAMSSTKLTAASSVKKAGRRLPTASSVAEITTGDQLLSAASGRASR